VFGPEQTSIEIRTEGYVLKVDISCRYAMHFSNNVIIRTNKEIDILADLNDLVVADLFYL
jgi:hypothetical protein